MWYGLCLRCRLCTHEGYKSDTVANLSDTDTAHRFGSANVSRMMYTEWLDSHLYFVSCSLLAVLTLEQMAVIIGLKVVQRY